MGADARVSGISGCGNVHYEDFPSVCVQWRLWHESGAYMLNVDSAPGPALLRTALARLNASGVLCIGADSAASARRLRVRLGVGLGIRPRHSQSLAGCQVSFFLPGPSPLADFKLAKRRVEAPRAPAPAWTLTEAQAQACGELSNGEYHAQYERTRSAGWVWTGGLEAR
jgi:hypothetical protein